MVVQEGVDGGLEKDGVVDGHRADLIALVPAWLSAASGRAVHHVVGDEEERLKLEQGKFKISKLKLSFTTN